MYPHSIMREFYQPFKLHSEHSDTGTKQVGSCDRSTSAPSILFQSQWRLLCKVCFGLHVAKACASLTKLAAITCRLCLGSTGFVGKAQASQSLRQCHSLAPSRSLLRTRKAQIVAAPARVLNIRADGSVKAAAVDEPPTSTSSGGKEKVKIGINGEL